MVIRIGAGEAQKALEDKKGGQEGKETNVGFSRDAAGRRDHRCGQIPSEFGTKLSCALRR